MQELLEQLTRERLDKIKSWADKYGESGNVMLPACEARALAQIALALMDANYPAIPDGWKLVPVEATPAMLASFNDSDYGRKSLRERYIQMLSATPQPE